MSDERILGRELKVGMIVKQWSEPGAKVYRILELSEDRDPYGGRAGRFECSNGSTVSHNLYDSHTFEIRDEMPGPAARKRARERKQT